MVLLHAIRFFGTVILARLNVICKRTRTLKWREGDNISRHLCQKQSRLLVWVALSLHGSMFIVRAH